MSRQSLEAFRRVVQVQWPKATEEGARRHLIETARRGHEQIMSEQAGRGSSPTWEAYANTPGNRNLESVTLPGPIVYRYQYLPEIVEFTLDLLRKESPVRSGDYVRSHTIYIRGVGQKIFDIDVLRRALRDGHELFISNPIIYARRIEVGKTKSGRSFVMQVPPRIYERVARKVRSRYGNLAEITVRYVELPDAATPTGGMARRTPHYVNKPGQMRKRWVRGGERMKAPAIFIAPRGVG